MAKPLQYITILWAKAMWICSPCVVILNSALATEPYLVLFLLFLDHLRPDWNEAGDPVGRWSAGERHRKPKIPLLFLRLQVFSSKFSRSCWKTADGLWHREHDMESIMGALVCTTLFGKWTSVIIHLISRWALMLYNFVCIEISHCGFLDARI